MSGTINGPNGLPDVHLLEKLANELFFSVPGTLDNPQSSTSVINQGNSVDLLDPQTSLPDANNLGLGHVPASTHGSGGISPGVKSANALPFENDRPFEKELSKALAAVNVYSP